MRTQLLLLIAFVFSATGCDKNNDKKAALPKGVYTGTFQRQIASGGQIVGVTLNLNGNAYNGQSAAFPDRYPVIGKGKYSISGDKILFQDSLMYTADFDWTLILSQEYAFSAQGDSLTIIRNYNGAAKDIYKLKRKQQQ